MTSIAERLTAALADRYRVVRELGSGGMATVYLAHDLRHDRQVAVKVLKPELAAVLGAERFVVEIKTTASLQHPHILPLFDSGTADGFLYYVMPFIQGETLRDRLDRERQLDVDAAVRIATEVADALDYAHRSGVIHRDIKPENILLHDGRPMVADFGIALAVSAAAGGRMTETGLSLGTPHYMSPEQATAEKEITGRSDIHSLASVLYEALTGAPPYTGGSAQQIIMKIITEPAQPVTQLRKSVPPNVAAAIAKALEKLPADRFASARAFADALANPHFRTDPAVTAVAPGATGVQVLGRTVSWRAVAGGLAVTGVALAAWALRGISATVDESPVVRAELEILTRSDSGVSALGVDISPDGSTIAYVARPPGGRWALYLRRLDELAARLVPGTEGAGAPAFSPDGRSLAFIVEQKSIRRIPVTGGGGETIVPATAERRCFDSLRWAGDGYLYYDDACGDSGLQRVSERGGAPQVVLDSGYTYGLDPLPDGRHALFTAYNGPTWDVSVLDMKSGRSEALGVQALAARYLPTGHLLLVTTDGLKAVGFDARTRKVQGEPVTILDSATANGTIGSFALSRTGTAIYFVQAQRDEGVQLTLVDHAGSAQRLPLPEMEVTSRIRFSPDGRRIAFVNYPDGPLGGILFVHDLVLGTTTRRAFGNFAGTDPVWTADGSRLLFGAEGRDPVLKYVATVNADGTGAPDTLVKLADSESARWPQALSPDGTQLLLGVDRGSNNDLEIRRLADAWREPSTYLAADWNEGNAAISPDGRWVAYESDEGRPRGSEGAGWVRVYVRSFPVPGTRFAVSDSAGRYPRWAPDGRTIYYWRGRTLVAASVRTAPDFALTGRREVFTISRAVTRSYDVRPDGRQFVMTMLPAQPADGASPASEPTRLVIVVNWLEEFKRKIGARK